MGNGESPSSPTTSTFPLTVPLSGTAQNGKITFYASGYGFVTEGGTARLTLRANGRKIVKNFPAGSDVEFVQTLQLPGTAVSECQLSLVIEVDQVAGSHEGTAYLNVSALDGAIS